MFLADKNTRAWDILFKNCEIIYGKGNCADFLQEEVFSFAPLSLSDLKQHFSLFSSFIVMTPHKIVCAFIYFITTVSQFLYHQGRSQSSNKHRLQKMPIIFNLSTKRHKNVLSHSLQLCRIVTKSGFENFKVYANFSTFLCLTRRLSIKTLKSRIKN